MNCRWREPPDQGRAVQEVVSPSGLLGNSTYSGGSRHRQEMYRPSG